MQVIGRKNARPRVNAIRSQSRVSRYPERGRQIAVGFLDTYKVYRMDQDKVEKFSASGSKTSDIPSKNPELVKERRESWK